MGTVESLRKNAPFIAVLFAILVVGLAISLATLSLIMRM
jgi:hypothetical protein